MGINRRFELQHYKIDTIIKAMYSARRNSKNIMLSGPIGTGKTTLCSQIADKLSLNFYPYSLCSHTTKSDLIGFIDAGGNYRTSALRLAFENGGLVLLDEMDAANPNILSIINNMLSNNQYYFPDGIVQKNDEFKCICAMNSNGRGGDIIYTKSQRLDASTLDRFIFINIDIDEKLEQKLTDNMDWYERVLKFRKVIEEICKDEVVIGSRAMYDGADLLEAGFSQSEVEDMVIYKGIDRDLIDSIKAKMDIKSEQYQRASSPISTTKPNGDNIYILTDNSGSECAWLDANFINNTDPNLLQTIKDTLNLKDKK